MSTTTASASASTSFPQLSIILDNMRDSFSFNRTLSETWMMYSARQWFNGTITLPATPTTSGEVSLIFNGISVAFFGVTPPLILPTAELPFIYSIDGSPPSNASFPDPIPPTYRQWFTSATLPEGKHTIKLSKLTASIDFAVVAVGKDTDISGERVIVDDDDPGVKYGGTWRNNRDRFSFADAIGFNFANSSHETSYVGNTVTYRFSGTAIAIYGEFDYSSIGLLTLTFLLDGQPLSQSYRVTATSPEYVSKLGQQPNYLFYSFDFLTRGVHTLVINVTECVDQTFRLDYLTYVPAFARVSEMPADLLHGDTTTGSGSLPTSSGEHGLPSKTYAGIAVGAILGAVVIALGMFLCFRRKAALWTKYSPLKRVTPFPPPPDIITITQAGSSSPQYMGSPWTETTMLTPYTLIGPNPSPSNPNLASISMQRLSVSQGSAVRPSSVPGSPAADQSGSSRSDLEPPSYEEITATSRPTTHHWDKP